MTERLGGTWLVEFVVSSSNLAYRTIGLSVLSFDLPIPPVFHPCLKMCQLTNHRSIVSHIYATNLVVVRRGVLRRRQDPPRDRLSHGRSRVSASEICEQPIPCLDQCVYNIDLGTHLPDESQTDDTSLACANARWSPANVTHTLSPHSSEALRKRPFWFGRIQVGFRSPGWAGRQKRKLLVANVSRLELSQIRGAISSFQRRQPQSQSKSTDF
jgi:hypothetical protein